MTILQELCEILSAEIVTALKERSSTGYEPYVGTTLTFSVTSHGIGYVIKKTDTTSCTLGDLNVNEGDENESI